MSLRAGKALAIQRRVFLLGFALVIITKASFSEAVRDPVSAGVSVDFGRIVKGEFDEGKEADGQVITRTGIFFTESGTYNQRLGIAITLGGLLWWQLPEAGGPSTFPTRIIWSGAGVGQAQLHYLFGANPESPFAKLQLGLFPIKYNPDAKNLGEYLFRSGTYPGIVYSGGWSLMNSASYLGQGVRFSMNLLDGMLVQDFSITMERDLEPAHNLSPAYLLTFKAGVFEFGTGVVWAHGIPVKPDSILSPKGASFENAYVKANSGQPGAGLPLAYDDSTGQTSKRHYVTGDPRIRPTGDPCLVQGNSCYDPSYTDSAGNGIPGEFLDYYSFQGFKTMARASLDFGVLLGMNETFGEGAFKLYGELALLGIEDKPFFYDDKSERLPVMFGMNIPTWKWLDMLGVEFEYKKSRFPNSLYREFNAVVPLPHSEAIDNPSYYDLDHPRYLDPSHPEFVVGARDSVTSAMKEDDWKWSVYARKNVIPGLTLHFQAARDNLRHISLQGTGGVRPMYKPTTDGPGDWYYLLRLEMGI